MDAYQAYTEAECVGFVSVGDGASHDTTKGAKTVLAHDGRNINEFQDNDMTEVRNENYPIHIAVNATVGTGSETSNLMVINDTQSPQAPNKWTTDKNIRLHYL